jgi:hypothetical protein
MTPDSVLMFYTTHYSAGGDQTMPPPALGTQTLDLLQFLKPPYPKLFFFWLLLLKWDIRQPDRLPN